MGLTNHARRISPRFWFYCKSLRYRFYNGEPEIRLLGRLLPECKLAIDIGSSIGLYSRELAKHATRVMAFEANPRVAAFARLVAPRNVEVINVALSSTGGETPLRIPINRHNNTIDDLATIESKNQLDAEHIVAEKVVTKRLDDYGLSGCGFIKIDVEGHEEAVLDGAERLIEIERPILMIELFDPFNPGITDRVMKRLSPAYETFVLSGNRLSLLAGLSPEQRANSGPNFFFVPHEDKTGIMKRVGAV